MALKPASKLVRLILRSGNRDDHTAHVEVQRPSYSGPDQIFPLILHTVQEPPTALEWAARCGSFSKTPWILVSPQNNRLPHHSLPN